MSMFRLYFQTLDEQKMLAAKKSLILPMQPRRLKILITDEVFSSGANVDKLFSPYFLKFRANKHECLSIANLNNLF
jgi:hypothetical protein